MRHYWSPIVVVLSVLLAVPAFAEDVIHWQNDLESAKVVAKQTNRLVLVHFWTPSCGPCMALEQNVFNQPGVASAIEQQFVPVKLNADENSATAQWFGITRVPTDVVVTPDGQIISKLVSPPTSAAYVAEVTAAAGKYASKSGQAFARAAAAAPAQSQINSAYANLQLSPNTQPAVAAQQYGQPEAPAATGVTAATSPVKPVENPLAHGKHHKAALAAANATPTAGPAPQTVMNPAATAVGQGSPAVGTPAGVPGFPAQPVANPYAAAAAMASSMPAQQTPVSPLISPAQSAPNYSANATLPVGGGGYPTAAMPASASTQVAARQLAGAPDPRQLPPGAPPLGFEGYCPVTMRNTWKWAPGDPRWGVVHRGRTYWFAGPEEQKQFWTDPDRYAPALSGMDPVMALDHQQQVPGKRDHSLDYDGLFYMFASEATLQQFTANPQRYAAGVRQAMGITRGRLVR